MKAVLLFTFGVSLQNWDESGILEREIALYKKFLNFGVTYKFLTYGNNKDLKYRSSLKNIEIFPVLNYLRSNNSKFRLIYSFFLPFRLKKLYKDIDLIKTNQIEGSWIAYISKILFKKKIIVRGGYDKLYRHLVLSNRKGIKNYFKYLLNYFCIFINEFLAFKLADGIILTNIQEISFIIKTYKLDKKNKRNLVVYLPNNIDTEIFKPLNILKKDKHILFIGRLSHQKNLLNLIYALKDLNEFTLDIIGDGPLKSRLNDKAKTLGVNVNFLGVYPNFKLPKIINQYEIFILPSFWEGNPKVLLETMSCGLCCIGSNIQGINNIINHKKNGYLCEFSPNSIRNAILSLESKKSLRSEIGKNARKYILDNCSLTSLIKKEYQFYQRILNN